MPWMPCQNWGVAHNNVWYGVGWGDPLWGRDGPTKGGLGQALTAPSEWPVGESAAQLVEEQRRST